MAWRRKATRQLAPGQEPGGYADPPHACARRREHVYQDLLRRLWHDAVQESSVGDELKRRLEPCVEIQVVDVEQKEAGWRMLVVDESETVENTLWRNRTVAADTVEPR